MTIVVGGILTHSSDNICFFPAEDTKTVINSHIADILIQPKFILAASFGQNELKIKGDS